MPARLGISATGFENVAAHLTDDGSFVVEAFVPAFLYRLRSDQYIDAAAIGIDEIRLDVARHNAATQRLGASWSRPQRP